MAGANTNTCLDCGAALTPVGNKEAPPWICVPCKHAFYNCELTSTARLRYRKDMRDFGIHVKTMQEQAAAEQATRRRS